MGGQLKHAYQVDCCRLMFQHNVLFNVFKSEEFMKVENLKLMNNQWQLTGIGQNIEDTANIVFVFGDTKSFKQPEYFHQLNANYPNAQIVGCSSSANILGAEVADSPLIATAVMFENSYIKVNAIDIKEGENIETISGELINGLFNDDLKHIFVLSDGLLINGSELVRGMNKVTKVPISGGMAGDGDRFEETWVIANSEPTQRKIVAVGFYGNGLTISSGCQGGWSEFGAERLITRSKGNVLYEIDHEPALDLYKKYLGDYAKDLPNSGLRFPLSIKLNPNDPETIRTLLAISEEEKSITFAGDVPEGFTARLMKPDIDILIDGAGQAAEEITKGNNKQALGLVVSCVGRKIIMNQLVDEELESIEEVLGEHVSLTGFYSYGEISPFEKHQTACQLHNQTMTLTAIYED